VRTEGMMFLPSLIEVSDRFNENASIYSIVIEDERHVGVDMPYRHYDIVNLSLVIRKERTLKQDEQGTNFMRKVHKVNA
jgi:hypothetical protein